MSTKPTTVPRWAKTSGGVDAANIAAPTTGEQDTGYVNGQTPVSSSKLNWLLNFIYQWTLYVKDAVFVADAGSGLAGMTATGDGAAPGVSGTGGATGPGVTGTGSGAAAGVRGTGGTTGAGVVGTGGATSGDGVTGTASAGNGRGVVGTGQGSGVGAAGTGGATGAGVTGTGGATSGDGVQGTASGGNSRGGTFAGQGSGSGAQGTGGATGPGLVGVGGATSGDGVQGTASAGNGRGVVGAGQGTGAGVDGTGGATGAPGVKATAGSGNTRGALALVPQATPSAPSDGDIWCEGAILRARLSGVTHTLLKSGGAYIGNTTAFSGTTSGSAGTSTPIITAGSWAASTGITWGAAVSLNTSTGVVTVTEAGTYRITLLSTINFNTSQNYTIDLWKNGAGTTNGFRSTFSGIANNVGVSLTVVLALAANDTVQPVISSTGASSLYGLPTGTTFTVERLA